MDVWRKILETATVALDKHKEEIEVKHKSSSARLQKRLTKRMSNKNLIGTGESGEIEIHAKKSLSKSVGDSDGLQGDSISDRNKQKIKGNQDDKGDKDSKNDKDGKDAIEKIRFEIASRVKTPKKLNKIFKKIDLDKSNSIDQREFQALLTATMAVKLEDVLFEKVWNIVLSVGNQDGEKKNSIDLLGLQCWLFGSKKKKNKKTKKSEVSKKSNQSNEI